MPITAPQSLKAPSPFDEHLATSDLVLELEELDDWWGTSAAAPAPVADDANGDAWQLVQDDELIIDEASYASAPSRSGVRPLEPLAQTAALGPTAIEDVLDEVDFFFGQRMIEDARGALADALEAAPNHPLLLDKRAELDAAARELAAREFPHAFPRG